MGSWHLSQSHFNAQKTQQVNAQKMRIKIVCCIFKKTITFAPSIGPDGEMVDTRDLKSLDL
jgi:hypothetical protein